MSDAMIIKIMGEAILEVLIISAPILGISMVVGLIISIFQTTTSIQEQTLTFVPKIVAIFGAIVLFSSWIMNHIRNYTQNLYDVMSVIGK